MLDQDEIRRQAYMARINRVMDYVRENLTGDLCLDTLAGVAHFSPHHFHRVFKAVIGETLNDFIRRIRAEKAASQLLHNPKLSITKVAMQCGYASPSTFAREFRSAFGMSASQFRYGGHASRSKIRQVEERIDQPESKIREDDEAGDAYAESIPGNRRKAMKFEAEVKEMPERHVAYMRHIGPYNEIGQLFGRLMTWAGPRGLLRFPETQVLAVYHDNPDITDADKLRSDACITVPEGTPVDGEVATMRIPGGLFAVAHVEIDQTQYGEAWDKLIGEWIPKSGYQPDDRLCYELYLNEPEKHPEKKHIVDICEPVRTL